MSDVEEYPAGATVEVTFRGTVLDGGHLQIGQDSNGGAPWAVRLHPRALRLATSTARLPDPEPVWQVGDVVAWVENRVRHVAMRVARVERVLVGYQSAGFGTVECVYRNGPIVVGWRDAQAADGEFTGDTQITQLWQAGQLTPVSRNGKPWPKPGEATVDA